MTARYDVIVIGAGLGGLSAAGYLAMAGKKVLLLEHHSVPGGYAHEFRRGKFYFEVALHAMDGVKEGGWIYPVLKDLGVLDEVHFHELDPFYTVRFPHHEVTVRNDAQDYINTLSAQFPEEREGITALINDVRQVQTEVAAYAARRSGGNKVPMQEMPTSFPAMAEAMMMTWGPYMDRRVKSPELKAILSTLWGYCGLPPSTLSAGLFCLLKASYLFGGAWYPEGGSIAISRAIEKLIKAYGGEVKYNQTVSRLEMRDGVVVGVETKKGLYAEADVFVSNASPQDTFGNMMPDDAVSEEYRARTNAKPAAASNLVVYMGLNRDLTAEGYNHHELFLCDTYDIEASYAAMMAGRFADTDIVATHYTPVCKKAAKPGYSNLVAMCLAPWDYENVWGTGGDLKNYRKNPEYIRLKEAAGNAVIDRVAKAIPGLRESIIECEIATPLTNVRYSLNPGGSIYGSEQTIDNMFVSRLSSRTPIDNLFLTGAWVAGGGMSTALMSGRSVAGQSRRYLDSVGV